MNSSLNKISKIFDSQNGETSFNSRKLPVLNKPNDYDPFQKLANAPNYLQDSEKKREKPNLKPINKPSYDRMSQKAKFMNNTMTNPQMMNMLALMQKQQSGSSPGNSPDKMGQTATFNPQLFQQFMATMGSTGFNSQMGMTMQAQPPKKKPYQFTKPRNSLYPGSSNNQNKDLYGSFDYNNQQLMNSSCEMNKSQSPKKKKVEEKKEQIVFAPKGEFQVVDNSKPLEQMKFEEEYLKKQEEKRKKKEELAKKKIEEERRLKQEKDKKKKFEEDRFRNEEERNEIKKKDLIFKEKKPEEKKVPDDKKQADKK
jgi:hypothetical protein